MSLKFLLISFLWTAAQSECDQPSETGYNAGDSSFAPINRATAAGCYLKHVAAMALPIHESEINADRQPRIDQPGIVQEIPRARFRQMQAHSAFPKDDMTYHFLIPKADPTKIRYFSVEQADDTLGKPANTEYGHVSMLKEGTEWNSAWTGAKVTIYAGTFHVNGNGKITNWKNDSGHFRPLKKWAGFVAGEFGFPWTKAIYDALVTPEGFDDARLAIRNIALARAGRYGGNYLNDADRFYGFDEEYDYMEEEQLYEEALANLRRAQRQYGIAQRLLNRARGQ